MSPVRVDPALPEPFKRFIAEFKAPDTPAGQAAETWLKESALKQHVALGTYAWISERRVEGFVATRAAEVSLSQTHRARLGKEHPGQGAILLAWIARHRDSEITALEMLEFVALTALKVAEHTGITCLAVDPYDAGAEQLWRSYGFRASKTKTPENTPRLWLALDSA